MIQMSRSSVALLIGSSGQASVRDRNACEHRLLIGTREAWVGAPPFVWSELLLFATIPSTASVQYAHHAVALQHKRLLTSASCGWAEVVTWVSAFSFVVSTFSVARCNICSCLRVHGRLAAVQTQSGWSNAPLMWHINELGHEQTYSFFIWCGCQIINWPVCPVDRVACLAASHRTVCQGGNRSQHSQ